MDKNDEEIEKWKQRLEREKKARKEAERLLEVKSKELYDKNQELIELNSNLDFIVKEKTKDLSFALKKAEAANVARRKFLANVTHELRTPLNGILGMAGLIADSELNSIQKEYVKIILASGEILLSLINNILDFSKIEEGKLEVNEHSFDLRELIENAMDIVSFSAFSKKLELSYDLPLGFNYKFNSDELKIKQVITNLLSNAIKFTDKGYVNLKLSFIDIETDSSTILITVEDTGIGIDSNKSPNIFEEFIQADISTTKRYSGTGLGLAICKKIIGILNGKIWFDSIQNKGSIFYIQLQLKKVNSNEIKKLDSKNIFSDKIVNLYIEDTITLKRIKSNLDFWGVHTKYLDSLSNLSEATQNEYLVISVQNEREYQFLRTIEKNIHNNNRAKIILFVSEKNSDIYNWALKNQISNILYKPYKANELYLALKGEISEISFINSIKQSTDEINYNSINILVVEDNPINYKLVSALLDKKGYNYKIATNGYEALNLLSEYSFDVVLMDCHMPEMDGYETTIKLRKSTSVKNSNIPVIALTANAMEGDREKCLSVGMDDFLSKPIIPNDLQNKILYWAKKNHQEVSLLTGNLSLSKNEIKEIYDNETLRIYYEDDYDEYKVLISSFMISIEEMIEKLSLSLKNNDLSSMLEISHSIKGITGNIQAKRLYQTIKNINHNIRNTQYNSLDFEISNLVNDYKILKLVLQNELKKDSFTE